MIRTGIAIAALVGLIPALAPALADEAPPPPVRTEPPIVGFIDTARPFCYARAYDAAHMKAHPKQKVTAIALAYVPEKMFPDYPEPQKMWDQYADAPAFNAIVAVRFRDRSETALGSAYCRTGSSKMLECGIEGDGGMFNVLIQDDGRVKLDNPDGFSVMYPGPSPETEESDADYVRVDPKDDQTAFLLTASTDDICKSDW